VEVANKGATGAAREAEDRATSGPDAAIAYAQSAQRRSMRQQRYLHHRAAVLAWAVASVGSAAVLLQEQGEHCHGTQRRLLLDRAAELDALYGTLRRELSPLMRED
jgi:hypothetical protein